MTENKRIKNRRDTAVNWTTNNPVLLAGEFGIEMDTRKLKVGDGVTAWNDLEYCSGYTEEEIVAIIESTSYTKAQVDAIKGEIENEIPVNTSDLNNNSGFITINDVPAQVNSDWNSVSGVSQILNKPSIPTNTSDLNNDSGFITSSDIPAQAQADWTEADSTSPSYIQHKPTIPTNTSDLNNDSGYITINDVPVQQNADWNSNSGVSQILNKPSIPTNTSDLNNDSGFITSSDIPAQQNADWNSVSGPSQILNKPTIPDAQVNSDWNSNSGVSQILNKPSIPTNTSDLNNDSGFITINDVPAQVNSDWNSVSGASQILNKPSIPVVNDSTINIYQGGTLKGSFTLNQASGDTINLDAGGGSQAQADWTEADSTSPSYIQHKPSIPSNTSDLNNDSGYITINDVPAQQNADWNSNSGPSQILNKPTIPAAQVNSDWNSVSGVSQILNKPTIPTNTSDLNNDSGFITSSDIPAQVQSNWNENDNTSAAFIQNKPTIYTEWFGTQAQYDAIAVKDQNTIYHIEGPAPVQSDWNENDNTKLSFILNKPSIPAAQVQSNWNESDNTSLAYIQNKPSIPTVNDATLTINQGGVLKGTFTANASSNVTIDLDGGGGTQVQSNWNENDNTSPAYIQNKPTIPTIPSYTTETWTFTLSDQSTVTKTVYLVPSV